MLAVARLAGKVGGLTEVFFTGLCGALPAPKCRAGGMMGERAKYLKMSILINV